MTTGEELDEAMIALRARGLSYPALAAVAEYVYGWRVTSEVIRRRLRQLGVATDKRWMARRSNAA